MGIKAFSGSLVLVGLNLYRNEKTKIMKIEKRSIQIEKSTSATSKALLKSCNTGQATEETTATG